MSWSRTALRSASRLAASFSSASSAAAAPATVSAAASAAAPLRGLSLLRSPADQALAAAPARFFWAAAMSPILQQQQQQARQQAQARSQAERQPAAAQGLQRQRLACESTALSPNQQALLDRNLVIDTLDTAKRLEAMGLSQAQAEALSQHLTVVLCANREKLEEFYASKVALEKSILEQEAKHAGFRSEVLKSQELQVATFTRDTERLQINLEKIRSEIRYEVDKLTASQRLDLNLEKGRMRDELQMLRDKSNELEIKMDKEVNSLKAAMEQSKNDTVKYVLGLMLALMTAGLGAARLLMH